MNQTFNFSSNFCTGHLSGTARVSLGVTLVFVFMIGGAGNCVLSIMVTRHTEMRSAINILLAQMAVADAFISLGCTPLDLSSLVLQKGTFSPYVCSFHAFALSTLTVHNVVVLVIISVDRYCILVHKTYRLQECNSVVLAVWCCAFSLAVSSPPLFGVGHFTFSNVNCRGVRYHSETDDFVYFGLFSSLLFVLPCGLLLLAYVHIFATLRKTTHRIRPEIHSSSSRTPNSNVNVRFKQKTFSTILCLYVAAMTFKLPLGISLLVKSVKESVTCPMSEWVLVFIYLNSAVNPFIYAFKISTYWMALTGKFRTVRSRVNSLRVNRKRSNPESVYRISCEPRASVI